ncbi:hypothetical protein DCAR_0728793 [Daucus carota subsp. sativus]|uniref:Uncharacterized protein n=1 Tax=Daucus carota subsp. sativus TaxID=79200 RepID=A0AAF1BAJ6_DAUCS|nr:hypothetical protein DCAR_0728793 [Daucus carota subsp. sativus]
MSNEREREREKGLGREIEIGGGEREKEGTKKEIEIGRKSMIKISATINIMMLITLAIKKGIMITGARGQMIRSTWTEDDVEEEDYKETIFMQLAQQEEEDLSRIKEESRRRRQAILEKYKTQQSQKKHELKADETGKASLVCLNQDQTRHLSVPGFRQFDDVSTDIKCGKGDRTRYQSHILDFNQMSEFMNQKCSVPRKIPSGWFNSMFGFESESWESDAAITKYLGLDESDPSLAKLALSVFNSTLQRQDEVLDLHKNSMGKHLLDFVRA